MKKFLNTAFLIATLCTVTFSQVGKVGINTTTPAAMLHVMDSSVLFSSPFYENFPEYDAPPPASGSGARMMWYPQRRSFRSGMVTGTQWNQSQTGFYSFASGYNPIANGEIATAFGKEIIASGYSGVVIGHCNDPIINTPQNAIEPTTPLFIIGNGDNAGNRSNALVVLKNGRIGIGTNAPSARLHVELESVLFKGPPTALGMPGAVPVSGAGTRMMWYADKAAFRIGEVSGTSWDKDSIGYHSFAAGVDTKAKGAKSTAFGYNTQATNINSTALGFATLASGATSTALGGSTIASGSHATAMGFLNVASGGFSTAMGSDNTASGGYSTVMGRYNTAGEAYATAMGYQTQASGAYAISCGNQTHASGTGAIASGFSTMSGGQYSTAMGYETNASGNYSLAGGYQSIASGQGSFAFGNDAIASGLFSIALGYSVNANETRAVALGYNISSSGLSSVAIGRNAMASEDDAIAIGSFVHASEVNSMAFGTNCTASASGAIVLGTLSTSSGYTALATGTSTKAKGAYSFTSGLQTIAKSYNSFIIGRYNDTTSVSSVSWIENDPLLIVGNGSGNTDRKNALTLLKNGKMGLGTVAPVNILQIRALNDTLNGPILSLGGTSPDQAESGRIRFYEGTASTNLRGGYIHLDGSANRFHIGIHPTSDNIVSNDIPAISIDRASGEVGIGTVNPGYLLEVNGTAGKPGGGSWTNTSDARLKQNVRPYTDGLQSILSIKPVRFQYNERSGYDTSEEYVGIIAQELNNVAPYMVNTSPRILPDGTTGYLDVDNSAMTYMLVNAVKEQQAIIDSQKERIDDLEKEMQTIKAILNSLSQK